MTLMNDIIKITLPLFIKAWKKRVIKHAQKPEELRNLYREGYWDGVVDTLQVGLKTEVNSPNDPTLH